MTYPQGYTPPPPKKPKPNTNLKPTQSDTTPLSSDKLSKWHDTTTMDDHLYDFEKETYSDTQFRKIQKRKYQIEKPFRVGLTRTEKHHGLLTKLMIKMRIAKEVKNES